MQTFNQPIVQSDWAASAYTGPSKQSVGGDSWRKELQVSPEQSGCVVNTKMSINFRVVFIQQRTRIHRNREYWVHPTYSNRLLQEKFHMMHSKLLKVPKIIDLKIN